MFAIAFILPLHSQRKVLLQACTSGQRKIQACTFGQRNHNYKHKIIFIPVIYERAVPSSYSTPRFAPNRTSGVAFFRHAFISNALDVAAFQGKIKCLCRRCCNMFYCDPFEVNEHLYIEGMDPYYIDIPWVEHGEQVHTSNNISSTTTEALYERNPENFLAAMLHDVFSNYVHMDESNHVGEFSSVCDETIDAHQFDNILREADGELYPSSRKKKLDFVVKLYQSKLLYEMSDATFGSVLALIREHFPMCNTLPPNLYYTKKIIRALGLDYQNRNACRNNCMLFWKEHVNAIIFAKCGANRYKQNKGNSRTIQCTKVPKKVLRYFPIGPRLQRLHMSHYIAELMIWHSEIRTDDGVLRHPVDSPASKHLDNTYPDFARECHNVRLGLANDGFNPFGMHGKPHNTWPVLVVVYNLPP